jgi:hypothetical protein
VDGNFDLFGLPIVDRSAGPGRPPYVVTEKNSNKVKLLLALGWANQRIANGLGISLATLKRYFRAELKVRDIMRDQLEARRIEMAMEQVNAGNVAAHKVLANLIDRNDRMEVERQMAAAPAQPTSEKGPMGKKVAEKQRAIDADADLMAELETEAAGNARH